MAHHLDPEDLKEHGITAQVAPESYTTLNNFISQYFNVTSISQDQIVGSINNGDPVMAFIITGFSIVGNSAVANGHEITIYGYNVSSTGAVTYNYINTINGSNQTGDGNNFGDTISISKR